MSTNIKNIKWFSIITGIFLALTYLFSVVKFDCGFMSSDFLFVAFGGIFASFCVVLISEIVKYNLNKKAFEDFIYQNLSLIYQLLKNEIQFSKLYSTNKSEPVPENLYSTNAQLIISLCNGVGNTDYCTINNNIISKQVKGLKLEEMYPIINHVNNGINYLRIAILQTKLDKNNASYMPVYMDPLVGKTINKMISDAEVRCKAIDGFLKVMESVYPKRFEWKKDKAQADARTFNIDEINKSRDSFFE